MAAGTKTVTVRFTGETRGLEKAAGRADKAMSGWGSKLASAGKMAGLAIASAGAALAVGAGAAALALLPLSKRLEDLDIKSKTVFGDQLGAVKKWADTQKAAFGTSGREVVGMAANLADLLKPMGFSTDAAAGMSTKLVGLSGALSKWSGGTRSAAEVSEILSSALLGERDALKGLGISISEADVQRVLAAKGQDKLTGAARDQAEALATQQLIFEKSADAQKAWGEGGKQAAEKQNGLSSRIQELKEKLAGVLAPAFAKVLEWLVKFAEWMTTTGIPALQRFGKAVGEKLGAVIDQARGLWGKFQPILHKVWEILGPMFKSAFDDLKQAWKDLQPVIEDAMPILKRIGITIGIVIGAAVLLLVVAFAALAWIIRHVIVPVLKFLLDAFWFVRTKVLEAWNAVWNFFTKTLPHMWDNVKTAALAAKDWIVARFNDVVGFVKGLPGRIGSAASGMWDGIKNAFRSAVNWIIDRWNNLTFTIGGANIFGQQLPSVTLNTPDIPRLATGGRILQTGLAVVHKGETVVPAQAAPLPEVLELHLDLGHGIRQVVTINLREHDRRIRRRAMAGAGAR